ncbi:hypothetical protein FSS13T_02510 [Flavobacterium saliperosum S13]|uniref:Calx-beta domain-containing protein n=2 Tax=Flavobacterium saliperosum TaxID=329186 RepID=A0A1G4V4I6_9FLAO|nr:hypothetical protein [Flavobacterium saliperosum]ESU27773.1 hypothetical protein FSS13T_02510 [Flavobacterium saliperosum S13]SCX01079.1 hypothetical protein SAMN02927925_00263 [Flavobacterium saliperosum]
MKKVYRNKFLLSVLLASSVLVSCEDDDSTLNERYSKPVIAVDQTTFSVTEGDEITINLSTLAPMSGSMEFKAELIGGTASFRDYNTSGDETVEDDGQGIIGHRFSFPAYATEHSITITPELDMFVEGAETMKLRLYSMGNANGALDQEITINIADYVSNDIAIKLDWSKTRANRHGNLEEGHYLDADGDEHPYTDYDFDFYVFDADFNEVSGFAAATGNAPEKAVLLNADLADGDYYIIPDLYDSGTDPAERFQFEINLEVAKYGVWYHSMPLTYFSDNAVSAPNGLNGGETLAAILTKSGTTYTLTDFASGDVLASGRVAQLKERIKAIKNIRRK